MRTAAWRDAIAGPPRRAQETFTLRNSRARCPSPEPHRGPRLPILRTPRGRQSCERPTAAAIQQTPCGSCERPAAILRTPRGNPANAPPRIRRIPRSPSARRTCTPAKCIGISDIRMPGPCIWPQRLGRPGPLWMPRHTCTARALPDSHGTGVYCYRPRRACSLAIMLLLSFPDLALPLPTRWPPPAVSPNVNGAETLR